MFSARMRFAKGYTSGVTHIADEVEQLYIPLNIISFNYLWII